MLTPTGTIHTHDRSNFDQRFDAEVDPRGTITIVCRVKFEIDKDMFRAEGYTEADMSASARSSPPPSPRSSTPRGATSEP